MFNTRLDLKNRAKARADQDGGDFPTDAQYNAFLDEAAREVLADLVLSGWPVDYDTNTIVTDGVSRVWPVGDPALVPTLAVTMVYTNYGGRLVELKRINPGHAAELRSSGASGQTATYYEVRSSMALGPLIEFFPRIPGTYFVDYIKDWPGFVNDGGNPVWNGPSRTDELIVLRAAAKGVRKEGRATDGDRLDIEYEKMLVKVKDMASRFDMRNPAEMRDVSPLLSPYTFGSADFFAGPGGAF